MGECFSPQTLRILVVALLFMTGIPFLALIHCQEPIMLALPDGPVNPAANPLLNHLQTLQTDFAKFDTAHEGGDPDHIVSVDDLKAVAADTRQQRFSGADIEAAQFFLDHPEALGRLDLASAANTPDATFGGPDARIGQQDVNAALRDAQQFDGAATFVSQNPSLPESGPLSPQQQAAKDALSGRNADIRFAGMGASADVAQQSFVATLKAHAGDANWIQGFFHSLGARESGSLLYGAMEAGGDSRTQAREALHSLLGAGMLNGTDLTVAQFKTDPGASAPFALKTLVDADQVQELVDGRRSLIAGTSANPVDTSEYNAYDAYLTVDSQRNSQEIDAVAKRYGIDPALLKGAVASELDFDHGAKDELQDGLWRNTPAAGVATLVSPLLSPLGWIGAPVDFTAPGVASVRTDALDWAIGELAAQHDPAFAAAIKFRFSDIDRTHGGDFNNSAEAAAIVLAAETDLRKSHGASISTPTDMAVTWAAFRGGIRGIMPGGSSYDLDEFLNNRLDTADAGNVVAKTGDDHTGIGGNAFQSEPYFEMLQRAQG